MTVQQRITNKKILVTGGAGFIGSNLCEDLIEDNEVVALDNLSTGNLDNLEISRQKGLQFIEGDIRDPDTCRTAMEGIDYVLHQAALGSVPRSINDPITSHQVNTTGLMNVLLAARDSSTVQRVVYASSSSVYGDNPDMPKVEGNEGKPLSPYAVTKAAGEAYANCFAALYEGLEIIGLRYFNVFGKYQNPNGAYAAAIPKFTMALMAHERPKIHGDGTQSRDFSHISNILRANHLAILGDPPKGGHQVYNVAYGGRATVNEIVDTLRDLLSQYDPQIADITPEYGPPRQGDVPHSNACIQKIHRDLGYEPVCDLRTGLSTAVEWYWERLGTACC